MNSDKRILNILSFPNNTKVNDHVLSTNEKNLSKKALKAVSAFYNK